DGADDGLWKLGGKRQTVYARADLSLRDRIAAVQRRGRAGQAGQGKQGKTIMSKLPLLRIFLPPLRPVTDCGWDLGRIGKALTSLTTLPSRLARRRRRVGERAQHAHPATNNGATP